MYSYFKSLFIVAALLGAFVLSAEAQTTTRKAQLARSVTTDTTSTPIAIPSGWKSLYGEVSGTGAVTQTQEIYGDINSDGLNGVLLCTITLSATTKDTDACAPTVAAYSFYYVVTSNTTGTGATGNVYAMY